MQGTQKEATRFGALTTLLGSPSIRLILSNPRKRQMKRIIMKTLNFSHQHRRVGYAALPIATYVQQAFDTIPLIKLFKNKGSPCSFKALLDEFGV